MLWIRPSAAAQSCYILQGSIIYIVYYGDDETEFANMHLKASIELHDFIAVYIDWSD